MNEDFHSVDQDVEQPAFLTSFLFQCNLFKLISTNSETNVAQCLVCKSLGKTRYCKGKSTSNYHIHMKRVHPKEYQHFLAIKRSGVPKLVVPPDEDVQSQDNFEVHAPLHPSRESPLFAYGFFEIRNRMSNKLIIANCMTCQRMGRQNLLQAHEDKTSNLLAHLRRMHKPEFEQYISLKASQSQVSIASSHSSDIQQPIVSTIKSEEMEFVDVNEDEMPDVDTWESYDSLDSIDDLDVQQMNNTESAATSTTKNLESSLQNDDVTFESNKFNDAEDDQSSNTNSSENVQKQLIFRGGFFRFLKRDGVAVRAECLNCRSGNVYNGHMWSNSNFLKHLSRMHPESYERFLALRHATKKHSSHSEGLDSRSEQIAGFKQSDFNRIVLDFMINGMHHPKLLEDPTFDTLLNDIASKRTVSKLSQKLYHIVSPHVLLAEINEQLSVHEESLQSTLKNVASISIALDAWTVHQKTFVTAIINWIDPNDFHHAADVLSCEVHPSTITNESLLVRLDNICADYKITDKVVAKVINNNRQYEPDEHIGQVAFRQFSGIDNHLENPTHLFESIGTKNAREALNDEQYAILYKSAFEKFDAHTERYESVQLSGKASSLLDSARSALKAPNIGSKISEIYNRISNLMNLDTEILNEISTELEIPSFTESDVSFLKEYVIVLEPLATAIEYLQKNQCYYATLLPMVYSMKNNLADIQYRRKIQYCQPLLTAISNGVRCTFAHLFDFDDEKCIPALIATCTHPFFKMRWLKGDMKSPKNTNRILDIMVQKAKELDSSVESENIGPQISSNDDEGPEEKRFKFSFDTSSDDEENDETVIQMDCMSFLKKSCQKDARNLNELKQHPWVQKLFMRYNSIVSSTAALERSVSLCDLIEKSQTQQFDDDVFCKLARLRARNI